MILLGRTVTEPVVVVPGLSGDAIIGQNVINSTGLGYDPNTKQLRFFHEGETIAAVATATDTWKIAELAVCSQTTIQPHQAAKIRVKLLDVQSGKRLPPNQDFICTISGTPIVARTDYNGVAEIFYTNTENDELPLFRECRVARAENLNLWEKRAEATAWMNAIKAKTRKVREDTTRKPLTPAKRQLIKEAIDRSKTIPRAQHKNYVALLEEFHDTISGDSSDIGHSATVIHDIQLTDKTPVYTKQYTLPTVEQECIRKHIQEWLSAGIIERSNSKYNSAIFCVKKKEGHGLRVVLDYRKLNAKSMPDRYSIKTAEQLISEVGKSGARIFTTLDLTSGFWQMELAEKARPMTAFTILGEGQFQWKRAAMGLTGCPSSFSRLIEIAMRGLGNVAGYVDDLLVYSMNHSQHLTHLRAVLMRLRDHGLKLNLKKCEFGATETAYLGHTLTPDGIIPGLDKTKAITEMQSPETPKQLKSFLGCINYFRNYIGHFAKKAAPLYELTRGDSEWKKGPLPEEARKAFELLKKEITGKPVLAYPNAEGKYHLYIDGALGNANTPGGLGSVLLQEQPGGELKPVGFAARQLQKHEKNYTAFLIELSAAIFAINYFAVYLRPNPFVVYSDHKPMTKLSTVHSKTLNRLQDIMREFHFDIQWVKGEDNAVADFLSRNAISAISSDSQWMTLEEAQKMDTNLDIVRRSLRENNKTILPMEWQMFFPQLALKDGIICIQLAPRKGFTDNGTWKVVCPKDMRAKIMAAAHDSLLAGHTGVFKTTERVRTDFWWPNFHLDIQEYIKTCNICQSCANKAKQPTPPDQHVELARIPNEKVHCDLFGPLQDEDSKNNYVCVITDAFSKYVSLVPIRSKEAHVVAQAICDGWVYKFGIMKELITDNGKEFANTLQKEICAKLGVHHHTTSPYWPRSNSRAEVFNKTLAHYLRCMLKQTDTSKLSWKLLLGPLMFSYNTSVSRTTKTTPHQALLNYPARAPLWPELDGFLERDDVKFQNKKHEDYLINWKQGHNAMNRLVYANNQYEQESREEKQLGTKGDQYDYSAFTTGQPIWAWVNQKKGANPKLAPMWERARILCRKSATSWLISRMDRSRKKSSVVNVAYLKPRDETDDEPPEGPPGQQEQQQQGTEEPRYSQESDHVPFTQRSTYDRGADRSYVTREYTQRLPDYSKSDATTDTVPVEEADTVPAEEEEINQEGEHYDEYLQDEFHTESTRRHPDVTQPEAGTGLSRKTLSYAEPGSGEGPSRTSTQTSTQGRAQLLQRDVAYGTREETNLGKRLYRQLSAESNPEPEPKRLHEAVTSQAKQDRAEGRGGRPVEKRPSYVPPETRAMKQARLAGEAHVQPLGARWDPEDARLVREAARIVEIHALKGTLDRRQTDKLEQILMAREAPDRELERAIQTLQRMRNPPFEIGITRRRLVQEPRPQQPPPQVAIQRPPPTPPPPQRYVTPPHPEHSPIVMRTDSGSSTDSSGGRSDDSGGPPQPQAGPLKMAAPKWGNIPTHIPLPTSSTASASSSSRADSEEGFRSDTKQLRQNIDECIDQMTRWSTREPQVVSHTRAIDPDRPMGRPYVQQHTATGAVPKQFTAPPPPLGTPLPQYKQPLETVENMLKEYRYGEPLSGGLYEACLTEYGTAPANRGGKIGPATSTSAYYQAMMAAQTETYPRLAARQQTMIHDRLYSEARQEKELARLRKQ